MTFRIIDKNGMYLGTIYAPNYETAFRRAVAEYGLEIELEEK